MPTQQGVVTYVEEDGTHGWLAQSARALREKNKNPRNRVTDRYRFITTLSSEGSLG
jgi:hypothetical protein